MNGVEAKTLPEFATEQEAIRSKEPVFMVRDTAFYRTFKTAMAHIRAAGFPARSFSWTGAAGGMLVFAKSAEQAKALVAAWGPAADLHSDGTTVGVNVLFSRG